MSNKPVMWAELQGALSAVGLDVCVDIPQGGCWSGTIDGKQFVMSIEPKDDDGFRPYMEITLLGQDEAIVVPMLAKFMGYSPFVKYHNKRIEQANVTYGWDKNAEARIGGLEQDKMLDEVVRLEEGFTTPVAPGPEQYFQEFTQYFVEEWRLTVETDPEATFGASKKADMLPFVAAVHPRIGIAQSMFGLSIICLEGPVSDVAAIVAYGLEPLLAAGVLTEADAAAITHWFESTPPTWDGSRTGGFRKQVTVDLKQYIIRTDDTRNHRDLLILPA